MICPPGEHRPSPNPRSKGSCVVCGRIIPKMRPRNLELERELTRQAATAGGGTGPVPDLGLTALAERRALAGGVRPHLNDVQETKEEYADARNYLVWGCERIWIPYLEREPWACDRVAQNMNSLKRLTQAWRDLLV